MHPGLCRPDWHIHHDRSLIVRHLFNIAKGDGEAIFIGEVIQFVHEPGDN